MINVGNMDIGGVCVGETSFKGELSCCRTRVTRPRSSVEQSVARRGKVDEEEFAWIGADYDGDDLRDRMSDVQAFTARYALSATYGECDGGYVAFEFCAREREGHNCITTTGLGPSKGAIYCLALLEMIRADDAMVMGEMDGPTGDATQESTKEMNTIITTDSPTVSVSAPEQLIKIMSEPDFDFPTLMSRWIPIHEFGITSGWTGETLELPRALYAVVEKTPNLAPFRNFVYSQPHIEVQIVVNGYKMCVGKMVAGVLHDPYMLKDMDNAAVVLQRQHIVLDYSELNQGELDIPFRFHRAAVRNLSGRANTSNETGLSSVLHLRPLSKFVAGMGSPGEIRATVLTRFKSSSFNAMTYALPVAEGGKSTIRKLIGGAEALLDILPIPLDKPADPTRTFVIPSGRAQFATGKGISGANPLRMDPTRLTPYSMVGPYADDPTNAFQLARKWGLRSIIKWTTNHKPNDSLGPIIIDPSVRTYSSDVGPITLTPLETAVSMFNFWAGTIEFELQFVSNSFHSGAVILSAEFGRSVDPGSMEEISSCYTKTFQLGEQRVVNFTVPYLYDTAMRRSNNPFLTHYDDETGTDDGRVLALVVGHKSFTRLRVSVLNALVPIQAVPQEVEILIFMRAGKDFTLQSLKPVNWKSTLTFSARSSLPFAQMDSDPTLDFNGTTAGARVNFSEEHDDFLDILKRPVMLFEDQWLPNTTGGAKTSFYLPIMPLSMQWKMAENENGFVSQSLRSPTAAILNLYRFWRGSIRFHIFARGNSAGNIYATLVPHTGSMFVGERNINGIDRTRAEPHNSGLMTEVGVLRVNSSFEIECPYDTENTWTLMWANVDTANVRGRDLGDLCAGHLAIVATEPDTKVDIWISCGDDFTMGNFIGAHTSKYNGWNYIKYDNDEKPTMHASPVAPATLRAQEAERARLAEEEQKERDAQQAKYDAEVRAENQRRKAEELAEYERQKAEMEKRHQELEREANRIREEAEREEARQAATTAAALHAQELEAAQKREEAAREKLRLEAEAQKAADDAKRQEILRVKEANERAQSILATAQMLEARKVTADNFEKPITEGEIAATPEVQMAVVARKKVNEVDPETKKPQSIVHVVLSPELNTKIHYHALRKFDAEYAKYVDCAFKKCPQTQVDALKRAAALYAADARRAFLAIRETSRTLAKKAFAELGIGVLRAETLQREADKEQAALAENHPKAISWRMPQHGPVFVAPMTTKQLGKAADQAHWNALDRSAKALWVRKVKNPGSLAQGLPGHEFDEYPYYEGRTYYIQAYNLSHDWKEFFVYDQSLDRYVWKPLPSNFKLILGNTRAPDGKYAGINFVDALPEMENFVDARDFTPPPSERRARRGPARSKALKGKSVSENFKEYLGTSAPVDTCLAFSSFIPGAGGLLARGLLTATKGVNLVNKADATLSAVENTALHVGPAMLDVTDRANDVLERVEDTVSDLGPVAVSMIKNVDGAVGDLRETLGDMSAGAQATMDNINKLCAEMADTAQATRPIIEEVRRQVSIFSNLTGWVPKTVDVFRILQDILVDCLVAYSTRSWVAIASGVLRLVSNVTGVTLLDTIPIARSLIQSITDWFDPKVSAEASTIPESATSRYVGCLASMIAGIFDVTHRIGEWSPQSVMWATVKSAAGALSVFRFVVTTFDILLDLIKWVLGIKSPEARALSELSLRKEDIEKFMGNCRHVMDEANSRMRRIPTFRNLAWATAMQAGQIQSLVAQCPSNANLVQLSKTCSEVIKHVSDHMSEMCCSPVRYEPYMLTIEGPPGIGKSFCADEMIAELTKDLVDHRGGLPVYTRNPAQIYWDGYADQPIIKYDDWMNSKDPEIVKVMISEMYSIKTTASFNPHMASIEEKKISGNPVLVVMLTNDAFPTSAITLVSSDEMAVLRRRDIVVRAELTTRAQEIKSMLEDSRDPSDQVMARVVEQLQDEMPGLQFPHLQFRCYKNGTTRELLRTVRNYGEIMDFLRERHNSYFEREYANYTRRFETMTSIITGRTGLPVIKFADPFEVFYRIKRRTDDVRADRFLADQCNFVVEQLHKDSNLAMLPPETPAGLAAESWSFSDAMLTVVALTADTIAGFMQSSFEKLKGVFERFYRSVHSDGTYGKCNRCKEMKTLHSACAGGHFLCARCVPLLDTCIEGCPMRASLKVVKRGDGMFYLLMRKVTEGAANAFAVVSELVESVYNITGRTLEAWLVVIGGIVMKHVPTVASGMVLSNLSIMPRLRNESPLDTSVYSWSVHTEERTTKKVILVTGVPIAQSAGSSDDPDDEHAHAFASQLTGNTPGLTPVTNPREVDKLIVPDKKVTFCLHSLLTEQVCSTSYVSDGVTRGWKVVTRTDHSEYYTTVSPQACGAENCPFAVKANQMAWGDAHLQAKRGAYAGDIAQLGGAGPKEEILARLPRMFWPTWYEPGEVVEQIKEDWWTYLGGNEVLKTAIYVLAAGASVVGAIMLGYKAYAWVVDMVAPVVTPQSESPGTDPTEKKAFSRLFKGKAPRFSNAPRAESVGVQAAVAEKVAANYMCVRIAQTDGHMDVVCLGLSGKTAMFPKHYYCAMEGAFAKGFSIYIFPPGKYSCLTPATAIPYAFDARDFTMIDGVDMCMMRVPQSIPMFKDIRKYFATTADLVDNPLSSSGLLVTVPGKFNYSVVQQSVDVLGFRESLSYSDASGNRITSADVLTYNAARSGMCGSMLLLSHTQRPIVSMHVAGNGVSVGYGAIVTSEAVGFYADEPVAEMEWPEVSPLHEDNQMVWADTAIHHLGQVPPHMKAHQPGKTKIVPSHLHDTFGEMSGVEPAILSAGDPRYEHVRTPLWHGVRKHGVITRDWPSSWTQEAADNLYAGWYKSMKPLFVNPYRLSPEQAVVGFEMDYYDPLRLDTSAGYPWNKDKVDKSKAAWINVTRNANQRVVGATLDPVLRSVMNDNEKKRRAGIVPPTIFADTLKDEKRPVVKLLKAGGTRVICASPLDFTLAVRQNFLHFTAAMMKNRFSVMSAVGINVHGKEWYHLASELGQASQDHIIELDYSNFGPGFNANVAKAAVGIMVKWTMENVIGVNEAELWAIGMACVNSLHIAGQTLYHQVAGSPSGAAFTTIINSIVNQIYILTAWRQMTYRPFATFRQEVKLFVYGDDLIMSVRDPALQQVWNAQTITAWFGKYGIVATTSDKLATTIEPFKTLSEATFLKRGFVRHPYRPHSMLAPLEKKVVYGMLAYMRTSPSPELAMMGNCQAALMEAHAWGEREYDALRQQIHEGLRGTKIVLPIQTWQDFDNLWEEQKLFVDDFWPAW